MQPSLRLKLIGIIKWTGIYAVVYYLSHPRPLSPMMIGACLLFGVVCAMMYKFLFEPALDRWAAKLLKKRYGNNEDKK